MTVTDQPSSASPAYPAPAAAPARLVLPGHRHRLGRVSVTQIVVVQLALVAALATYPTPDWVFLPVLALALAVVAAMFVRRGRRWWYEEMAQRWWFGRRARRHAQTVSKRRSAANGDLAREQAAGADGDQPAMGRAAVDPYVQRGMDRMAFLTRSVAFHDVTDRGTRMGIGVDAKGWYAAMVVTPADEAAPDLDRMLAELAATTPAISALQVVHHVVPVPTVTSGAGHWTWVSARITAADAPAEAASRGGGVVGVHRTIAAATNRVSKTLRVLGADCRQLISDELADVLAVVGGWSPDDAATGRASPEHWTAWHGTEGAHVCFRMSGVGSLNALATALSATALLSATVSVRFTPASDAGAGRDSVPAVHGLLRVGTGADLVDATVDEVVTAATGVGVTLHRLDGVHAPALYAIAPTAATLTH